MNVLDVFLGGKHIKLNLADDLAKFSLILYRSAFPDGESIPRQICWIIDPINHYDCLQSFFFFMEYKAFHVKFVG